MTTRNTAAMLAVTALLTVAAICGGCIMDPSDDSDGVGVDRDALSLVPVGGILMQKPVTCGDGGHCAVQLGQCSSRVVRYGRNPSGGLSFCCYERSTGSYFLMGSVSLSQMRDHVDVTVNGSDDGDRLEAEDGTRCGTSTISGSADYRWRGGLEVLGGGGNDYLWGLEWSPSGFYTSLYGEGRNDRLYLGDNGGIADGGEGQNYLYGGRDGYNVFMFTGGDGVTTRTLAYGGNVGNLFWGVGFPGIIQAYGGGGDDFFNLGDGNDVAFSNGGSDLFAGGGGENTFYGGDGGDIAFGSGNFVRFGRGWSQEEAMENHEPLLGGVAGNCSLMGNSGDDLLICSRGENDRVNGGPGRDTCAADTMVHCEQVVPVCGDGDCNDDETYDTCPADCPVSFVCGDGTCNEGVETCDSCEADCGACPYCGDGICSVYERSECEPGDGSCMACPSDCGYPSHCGDGFCLEADRETCWTCPSDCSDGEYTYPGVTGSSTCPISCGDEVCSEADGESCANCQSDCGWCACGDGHCAEGTETCTSCPGDCGACPFCGDHVCDEDETTGTCPADCPPVCGDGSCEGGETPVTCPADCDPPSFCGDGFCDEAAGEWCRICPRDCGGCESCGDGICNGDDDCQSCPADCSHGCVLSCGDGYCLYEETCATCPGDCGSCG